MSIYAKNYTVDEITGKVSLIKHLNKNRIDRGRSSSKGWSKSGKKARYKKKGELNKNTLVKDLNEVKEKLTLRYFLNKIKNEN
jgi:hypothetical protein